MNMESFLERIGVYGYNDYGIVIMTSLVTEKPIILIGETGTAKTYLLNNLSVALGLKHKHYNASLISFDDLIGYPFPSQDRKSIEYIKTEATIWDSESVFIDEINRCKPEIQNKLFSIIYEKKIQGIDLKNLRYRWAAMNPYYDEDNKNNNDAEIYEGTFPLDIALADRFSLFVISPELKKLKDKENILLSSQPQGKDEELVSFVERKKQEFSEKIKVPDKLIQDYVIKVVNMFIETGINISPRRMKIIYENLVAASVIRDKLDSDDFFKILYHSLPSVCWGKYPDKKKIYNIHRIATKFISGNTYSESYFRFLFAEKFEEKTKIILSLDDIEKRSAVIMSFINSDDSTDEKIKIAYLYCIFQDVINGKIKLNYEATGVLVKYVREKCFKKKLPLIGRKFFNWNNDSFIENLEDTLEDLGWEESDKIPFQFIAFFINSTGIKDKHIIENMFYYIKNYT